MKEEQKKFSYEKIDLNEQIIEKATEVLNLFPNINTEDGIKLLFDSLIFCLNFGGDNYINADKHADIVGLISTTLFPNRKKPKSMKKDAKKHILNRKVIDMII